jgi:hypothetical protein
LIIMRGDSNSLWLDILVESCAYFSSQVCSNQNLNFTLFES